ncbi:MAG: hypothetical protein ABSA40_00785 [Candidatus Dormibacteria bacterium]|jgi:hypothetical protein
MASLAALSQHRHTPLHRATTRHLQSIYPGIPNGQGHARGVYIGRDLFGGSFVYDPWELYQAGLIANPNMLVIGQIGRAKSSLVKTYVSRQLVFGRQALTLDPKGENGPLCRAAGVAPIALRPDAGSGGVRLNPLDLGQLGDPQTRLQERAPVISAICGASLQRPLTPEERLAIELAVDAVTPRAPWRAPTLPSVVDSLLAPSERAASDLRLTTQELRQSSRSVALELRRLVDGDLRDVFDDDTYAGGIVSSPDGSWEAVEASVGGAVIAGRAGGALHTVYTAPDGQRPLPRAIGDDGSLLITVISGGIPPSGLEEVPVAGGGVITATAPASGWGTDGLGVAVAIPGGGFVAASQFDQRHRARRQVAAGRSQPHHPSVSPKTGGFVGAVW